MSSHRTGSIPASVPATLVDWFERHRRPLPWRRDRDPYRIWVAEVLLQQTRVAQAIPYYDRFLARFPTVETLARATEEEVLKVWEGAGYYARARNLRRAAQRIAASGRFPRTVEELERLPGVGPYIARAVASLAFGEPVIALEANGLRVAARWTRESGDVRSARVRDRLASRLDGVLPARAPGLFNEALMELGETVCLPVRPRCDACPVATTCRAKRELRDPGAIPRRRARRPRPHVRAAVVLLERRGRWLFQRRPADGLLGGLWELPGGKVRPRERPADAARRELVEETGFSVGDLELVGVVRHGYSHFTVELWAYRGTAAGRTAAGVVPERDRRWLRPSDRGRLPIPKATEKVLRLLGPAGRDRASPGSGSRQGRTPA